MKKELVLIEIITYYDTRALWKLIKIAKSFNKLCTTNIYVILLRAFNSVDSIYSVIHIYTN